MSRLLLIQGIILLVLITCMGICIAMDWRAATDIFSGLNNMVGIWISVANIGSCIDLVVKRRLITFSITIILIQVVLMSLQVYLFTKLLKGI